MKYYEAIYIAHPSLEDAALAKLVDATKSAIGKRDGEVVYEEVMGKKRLAYPVEKQRFGTYVLIQFTSEGEKNSQLNQDLELLDDVLAHMIVSIDAEDVYEEKQEAEPVVEAEAKTEDKPAESVVEEAPVVEEVAEEIAETTEEVVEEQPETEAVPEEPEVVVEETAEGEAE